MMATALRVTTSMTTTMPTTTTMATARRKGDDQIEGGRGVGRPSTKLWRCLLTKNRIYILDRVFINSSIFFLS
jgi:hypothetical protein